MRILEIGGGPFVSSYAPAISDFYCTFHGCDPAVALTRRRILALRKRLRAGEYDLVVYHITAKATAPWHRGYVSLGALGGTVISGGTRPASRQLICNRFGTGMARQLVGHPKATQSKRTRTADQITH